MAQLSGLNINPDVPESGGDFVVLPPGKYQAVIIGDTLKDTKAGTGKILEVRLQIQDRGEFYGTEIIDRLNIINPSEKAQAIGQGVLKRICNLTGAPFPPPDTRKCYGKPMTITVKIEEFESNNSGKMLQSNKVTGYAKAGKSTPPPAPAVKKQEEPAPSETQPEEDW